jgi:plastocyanin
MRTESGCHPSKCRTSGASSTRAALALCAVLSAWQSLAMAAELRVSVLDNKGHGVAGIVIVAESATAPPAKHAAHVEVMDQHHMQFVPNILVIQTGSAVDFPNSDQIEHQVYSFSPTKSFQLSLYAGHKYPPIVFDRPGLVTVGCNIHDFMIGYIYVTNSAFFGRTDADGQLQLHSLPAGSYTLTGARLCRCPSHWRRTITQRRRSN